MGTTTLRGRIVTPAEVIPDGVLAFDGAVTWVGPAGDWTGPEPEVVAGHLLPGLVDVHCHGGGGVGFPDATSADEVRTAIAEHLRRGTTSLVASLVTDAPERLREQVRLLASVPELAGIHLEGPFLSDDRAGAQNRAFLSPGDPQLLADLIDIGDGRVVTSTLAPEVDGSDELSDVLIDAGALPSFGHTAATLERTEQAIAHARERLAAVGAQRRRPTVTHLFNAMPPMQHRDPGPVPAFLVAAGRGDVVVELIGDGVHVAPGMLRAMFELLGSGSICLVTDAISATGSPDGTYELGGVDVIVADGVARLASTGALAGSTSHLLESVRVCVAAGVPLAQAVRAATLTPAEILERDDLGRLFPGARADVLVVDADFRPLRVYKDGSPVAGVR